VHPAERGQALGANDTFSNAMGVFLPLAMGVAVVHLGLGVAGLVGMGVMVPPFLLALALREGHPILLPADGGKGERPR
jgi:hypothetical protein